MEIQCIICKQTEQLSQEKLEKAGKFIEENALDAVDFLNYLSLLNGKTCNNNKKHKYEFTENFDKEVHELSKEAHTVHSHSETLDEEIQKLNRIIQEAQSKIQGLNDEILESGDRYSEYIKKLREIAYITNERLWL